MLSSYWQCPRVLYLKIKSTERARASSLPTNYFPEANGKGGERKTSTDSLLYELKEKVDKAKRTPALCLHLIQSRAFTGAYRFAFCA